MGMLAHRHMVEVQPKKVEPKPIVEDKVAPKATAEKKSKGK